METYFFMPFQASYPNGSVDHITVLDGGEAYTSTGSASAYFPALDNGLYPAKLQAGTIGEVLIQPFTNLKETPRTFMSGCISGSITVPAPSDPMKSGILSPADREGMPRDFLAHYSTDSLGAIERVCFGQLSGEATHSQCARSLSNHGEDYSPNPSLLVDERGISAVRVRSGSVSQGCRRNGRLLASHNGEPSVVFQGTYSVDATGSLESANVIVHDAAFSGGGSVSVFPSDVNCTCGSGLENVNIMMFNASDTSWGYVPNGTGSIFVVAHGHSAASGSGQGFVGSFTCDGAGRVRAVSVIDAGAGYSSNVSLALCPAGTRWSDSLVCCHLQLDAAQLLLPTALQDIATGYTPATGCFVLQQPRIHVQIGKAGGVAGSFDECLEIVAPASACRCGSGFEELMILDGGAGYVDGPLHPIFVLPDCCLHSDGCVEQDSLLQSIFDRAMSCDTNSTDETATQNIHDTSPNVFPSSNSSDNITNSSTNSTISAKVNTSSTSTLNASTAVNVSTVGCVAKASLWCATTAEHCNDTCVHRCVVKIVTKLDFQQCVAMCLRSSAQRGRNYTTPLWCSRTDSNFKAHIQTLAHENRSSTLCQSPEAPAQCNREYSGRVENVVLENAGLGFNKSTSRLALMYPPGQGHLCGTQCSVSESECNQSSLDAEPCEQSNTINSVDLSGNLSSGSYTWNGHLGATCQGVPSCTGSGVQGM